MTFVVQIWNQVFQWPILLQGIVASALFTAAFGSFKWILSRVRGHAKTVGAMYREYLLIQELIYRKYTRGDGLMSFAYGAHLSFRKSLEWFAEAATWFLFGCVIYVFYPSGSVGPFIAAVFYTYIGKSWISPRMKWLETNGDERWKRIAEIETELDGEPADDTKAALEGLDKQQREMRLSEARILLDAMQVALSGNDTGPEK